MKVTEQKFRMMFDNSLDGLLIAKPDGTLHEANAAFCNMLGFTRDELLKITRQDITVVTDKDLIDALRIRNDTGSFSGRLRLKKKSGELIDVEISTSLFDDENGEKFSYVCARDVTERKQTEIQLAEAVGQLKHIFDNIEEGLFAMDMVQHRYIYLSPGCEKIYGAPITEFYEKPNLWFEIVHPDDRHIVNKSNAKLAAGEISEMQVRVMHKNARVRWVEARIIPELNAARTLVRVEGIVTDITARKEAELKLEMLNHSLENEVADRTQQLNDANKALESFSYTVAHDLQTPLRILTGYARILDEDYSKVVDENGKELIRVITGNAQLMSQLITALLNFSRISRAVIKTENVDFDALVAEVIETVKSANPGLNATFKIGNLGVCNADITLFKQVWLNIISNAVKYSAKSEQPVIEIGTTVNNGQKVFYVKDNGVGFDMINEPKLFNVFSRLHKADEYEGTGVGLALAHNIITRHHGKIWAEAAKGKGAAFYFFCG